MSRRGGYRKLESADLVLVDTGNLDQNLSPSDDTVQKALDKIDDLVLGGSSLLSGTINRTGNLISSVVLSDGSTITITRSGNYITSVTNGVNTWTFTRNGSNQIISWAVT